MLIARLLSVFVAKDGHFSKALMRLMKYNATSHPATKKNTKILYWRAFSGVFASIKPSILAFLCESTRSPSLNCRRS
jgi:hypothetical protein